MRARARSADRLHALLRAVSGHLRRSNVRRLAFLAACWPTTALAAPQFGSDVLVGGGAVDLEGRTRAAFDLGLRLDLVLFRERERDMGVGPFVAFEVDAFKACTFEAGAEWLVPAWGDIPFVFSAGAFERNGLLNGYAPGVLAQVLWGPRSYNFGGDYGLSGGIFVEARRSLGGDDDTGIVAGVAIDTTFLAYPFLLVAGAFLH